MSGINQGNQDINIQQKADHGNSSRSRCTNSDVTRCAPSFAYLEEWHTISSFDLGACRRQRLSGQRRDHFADCFLFDGRHFFSGTQYIVVDYKRGTHILPVIKHPTSDATYVPKTRSILFSGKLAFVSFVTKVAVSTLHYEEPNRSAEQDFRPTVTSPSGPYSSILV